MTYNNNNTRDKNSSQSKKAKKVFDINIHKYDIKEFEKEGIPFAQICRSVIRGCTNHTAGWIWMYLQDMPPTWVPCKWEIMKHFNISEPTYKRHMQYLKSCGLVELHQSRNEDGTLGDLRIVVLSGTKFNPLGDSYQGIIFDTANENEPVDNFFEENSSNRGIKNDPPVKSALEAASHRGIKNDPPVSDRWIKKPVTGEMIPHINNIYNNKYISHTHAPEVEEEFFLEKTLYLDSEQQRKAIAFRQMCLKDEKAKEKHASLKTDKTYPEMLDECISHYASQLEPQLVSAQRFQSWLNREAKFQKTEAMPSSKYPSKEERASTEQKIREREIKAQEDKNREIYSARDFVNTVRTSMGFAEASKKAEEEMQKLGMSAAEYHAYVLKKAKQG